MFQNKNVVITGAGRGIGRALAIGFAEQGANVLIHYAHAEQQAQTTLAQIEAHGGKGYLIQADLSQPAAVQLLVEQAHATLGFIDVWINNAGASANTRETRGMDEIEQFDHMMDI